MRRTDGAVAETGDVNVIRVLIVDDHQMMAEGVRAALESEPDIEVVAMAGTAADAVARAEETLPDVVLMDFRLPDRDGSQATLDVRAAVPGVAVVMLTGFGDDATLTRAIDAGCAGFVHKTADIDTVVDAVRRARAGEPVFSAEDLSKLVRHLRGDTAPVGGDLTARELEVLQFLAEGVTTDALAERLYISKHTARSHVRNILAKLGAHSKLEAVAIAARAGIVTLDTTP
jgi:DNA-binding NarL/FixJ family response regulator